jgi:hypothetical protein
MMLDKLFGKKEKAEAETPKQSQSMSGIGGSAQQVQAGRDAIVTQEAQQATQQQGLTGAEVVTLLAQLQGAIEASGLTSDQKEELQDYLKAAKREAGKESPDKDFVGKNLKNVGETIKNLKDATEAGKSLWQTGGEVFKKIAPWLGVAASVFGVM